jgi:hypothetical protein
MVLERKRRGPAMLGNEKQSPPWLEVLNHTKVA